jgi:hypothetical protein
MPSTAEFRMNELRLIKRRNIIFNIKKFALKIFYAKNYLARFLGGFPVEPGAITSILKKA